MKTFNIFGDIIGGEAERWYSSEVSPQNIIDFLAEANGEAVEININSYGGSVTGGIAICNALKAYKGEVTCNVLGIAASMASAIACAGKRLCMGEGSFLMIHNPWTYTSGNAEDLRKDAETLDQMRDSILGFYLSKNSKTADEIKGYMDAETWIAAENAAEFGFEVEQYTGELKAAAALTRRAFAKAPEAVKAIMIQFTDKKPEAENAQEAPAEAPGAKADEPKAEAPKADEKPVEAPQKPCDWEARFKGLSTKYNELKAKYDDAESKSASDLVAVTAERDNLKAQVDTMSQDLTAAKAKVSELEAKLAESDKALQTATKDLADVRNSLKVAEDKAKELEATRDMITAGVLTPPEASSYADKMKAAKTPAEREALRAQKKAGKIH